MRAAFLLPLFSLVACGPASQATDAGQDAGDDAGIAVDSGVPRDLDIAVLRLTSDGQKDSTFGTGGVRVFDFATATGSARDTVYGFDFDAQGRVLLFGSTKATGRSDVDRFVARLTLAGELDTSFAVDGLHKLDLGGSNEAARHGFVQADGKIVTAGYSPVPSGAVQADGGVQTANHVVLLRLLPDGAPDPTFGTDGIVKYDPWATTQGTPWGYAEAYGVVRQSSGRYVTAGYGRMGASGTVDVVSLRFDDTGKSDGTWNGSGVFTLDLIGGDDRARHAVLLPDDRVLIVGSATTLTSDVDALVAMVKSDGSPDTSFGSGGNRTFAFSRKDEAFVAAALSPGALTLAAVGYRTGPANTDAENDDAVLALIPLSAGGAPEFVQAVPLSTTGHDRFLSVAFDGNKVVAAGFVREGNESKMAVARFNLDGTRDATFGTNGLVTFDLASGGTEETARWLKVTTDGKYVIAGPIEH
ncbi:MAG: hypothetical protein U0228_00215 [Myxococcaceae bacterium]